MSKEHFYALILGCLMLVAGMFAGCSNSDSDEIIEDSVLDIVKVKDVKDYVGTVHSIEDWIWRIDVEEPEKVTYGFYNDNRQYRKEGLKIRFSGTVCKWNVKVVDGVQNEIFPGIEKGQDIIYITEATVIE